MKRRALYFAGPEKIDVREEPVPEPGEDEVLVRTHISAVSAGTEMLLYRGQFPADMAVDETVPALAQPLRYPLKYGYAAAGSVVRAGKNVSAGWEGKKVFCLHPHESHFACGIGELVPLPEELSLRDAVFLPFMETAVALVMDGAPAVGECAAIFGQGVIGLLTTALLARFPLGKLAVLDRYELRRQKARDLGAHAALDPSAPGIEEAVRGLFSDHGAADGADLTFELSGNPAALDPAIAVTGFGGRIVAGSWYGTKEVAVRLGEHFHRRRHRIISSQVSTIAPEHRGRWTKPRRLAAALQLLGALRPSSLISHAAPVEEAARIYDSIARDRQGMLQAVFEYRE